MSFLTRLKKRHDFTRVSRSGFRSALPGMVILAGKNQEINSQMIRVGFTASRKIGKAFVRNRAKRRLRALAQEILGSSGKSGYDYVFIAREKTLTSSFDALKQDLTKALKSIHEQTEAKYHENNS